MFSINVSKLQLRCDSCTNQLSIVDDLSSKAAFFSTRHDCIRRDRIPPDEVSRRFGSLLMDMKGLGPQKNQWGVSYKREGGEPQFVVQAGAVERAQTMQTKALMWARTGFITCL